MHPEMQSQLDNLTRDLAHKHQVSTSLVNLLIQGALLRTKLTVLGATVKDKSGKIDVKDSCEKIVTEILNLCYIGAGLELGPDEQRIKNNTSSGIQHSEIQKQPAQVRLVNLAREVEEAMNPLINQYFLGIESGRKPS